MKVFRTLLLITLVSIESVSQAADRGFQISATPAKVTVSAPLAKAYKATGVIGMDVRNDLQEHLGKIKDVVFDYESERVGYAVISTGGGLFRRAKLLAVPLSTLAVSPDQTCLILRAEKGKLDAATGFDRNNWPSVTSPSWGAQPFWMESPTAPGLPALPRTQTPSVRTNR